MDQRNRCSAPNHVLLSSSHLASAFVPSQRIEVGTTTTKPCAHRSADLSGPTVCWAPQEGSSLFFLSSFSGAVRPPAYDSIAPRPRCLPAPLPRSHPPPAALFLSALSASLSLFHGGAAPIYPYTHTPLSLTPHWLPPRLKRPRTTHAMPPELRSPPSRRFRMPSPSLTCTLQLACHRPQLPPLSPFLSLTPLTPLTFCLSSRVAPPHMSIHAHILSLHSLKVSPALILPLCHAEPLSPVLSLSSMRC